MSIARSGKRLVEKLLFTARRLLVEKRLDPRRDSVLISWATYSPWLLDRDFQACHAVVRDHTLVDLYRCWELWHLVAQVRHLAGDILEVGTWRGGTGALMAKRAQQLEIDATVYLADTFTGVVKTDERADHYRGGEHADTTRATVEALLTRLEPTRVEILQGVFPEDTGDRISAQNFRLCHIDVDVYRSGRDVVDWIWPRLVVGGLVVFDDFGFATTPGIAELVHELEDRSDLICLQNLNGHAVLVKTVA